MQKRYEGYKAHEMRKDVVHASDDEFVVLMGPLSVSPGKKATFTLEFPKQLEREPELNLRFIPEDDLETYIRDCEDGERDIPPNFDSYDAPDVNVRRSSARVKLTDDRPGRRVERWSSILGVELGKRKRTVEVRRIEVTFTTAPSEGAYIFHVERQPLVEGGEDAFTVAVYNKPLTYFPESEDDDLADLLYRTVNLTVKNGLIWFVQPIYFVEQLLNVKLSDDVIEEMVTCEGLPEDLPADDDVVVKLQWGFGFRGLKKIRIDVDSEEDVCIDTQHIQVVGKEDRFSFQDFIQKI